MVLSRPALVNLSSPTQVSFDHGFAMVLLVQGEHIIRQIRILHSTNASSTSDTCLPVTHIQAP